MRLRWPTLRGFAADRRGVAAVEFALVVPIVIVGYLAGFEVMEAATVDRKPLLFFRGGYRTLGD